MLEYVKSIYNRFDMSRTFQNVPTRSYNTANVFSVFGEKAMSLKIMTFTVILALLLSPVIQMVNAQENETETSGTNTTVPNPLLGVNTTLANSTMPQNTSSSHSKNSELSDQPIDPVLLESIMEQTQSRALETLQLLGDNPLSTDISNSLIHAQQAMDQAQNMNNSRAAAQQYLRAMKLYRNALRNYLRENPDALTNLESSQPQINGTAADDINGTVTEQEINSTKVQLINQFEERFRAQISAMIGNVDNATDYMSPKDAFKAQQALTKAEEKLLRIQEHIQNGQYGGALDDLDNTTTTLDNNLNNMTDTGTSQMLRTMNQLEAKIQRIEQKAAQKAAKGQSTVNENALIAELKSNKNHVKNDYNQTHGNNNNSGNNGKGKN